jgi:hypothetical protein
MIPEADRGLLDRLVAPWPLLAGIVSAFLTCCLAGRLVSRRPLYERFGRFHRLISPESLYYPTASQLKAQAEAGLRDDQVLVVVGGSSVLHGVGQREEQLWTKKLQALLGDGYRVINLAMRAGGITEFGGVAAEMVAPDHPKLIFVTYATLTGDVADPSGGLYRYLFWDAVHKGHLPADQEHAEWIARVRSGRTKDPTFPELRWQMLVDGAVYGRDLWTTVAYRNGSTVWSPLVARSTIRPRREYPDIDPEQAVPFAQRYAASADDRNMAIVRSWIKAGATKQQGPSPQLVTFLTNALPPSSRPRTLVIFCRESPYYLDRLAPDERAQYEDVITRGASLTEQAGIRALAAGDGWNVDDYCDRCHLSEAGGAKLAALVVARVEEMARQLGYIEAEEKP